MQIQIYISVCVCVYNIRSFRLMIFNKWNKLKTSLENIEIYINANDLCFPLQIAFSTFVVVLEIIFIK